jgi:hypothetical protein
MGREHLDVVGQLQDLLLDGGAVGPGGLLRLLPPAQQVGPSQIADQQRAAGQQQGRLVGAHRPVVDQQAETRLGSN